MDPITTCSNYIEVDELGSFSVMTLKELDESISPDLERCKNCKDKMIKLILTCITICDLLKTLLIYINVVRPSERQAATPCTCAIFLCWTWTLALASTND